MELLGPSALAVPSLVVLAALIVHSAVALPARRAAAFWITCAAYGMARGVAVRWITERGLDGQAPYVVGEPLLALSGVPLQEIVGWAVVAYLGWWLGWRLATAGGDRTPRLFVQLAWAMAWLAAISLAVETGAIAAGWWVWRLPSGGGLLGEVPLIGVVDWAFVAVDFLLPWLVLSVPGGQRQPLRWLALAAFPAHFGGHLFVERLATVVPVPAVHAVHWVLLGLVVWLVARSTAVDDGFSHPRSPWLAALVPLAGVLVLADLAVVLVAAGRPALLAALLPAAAVLAVSCRPGWAPWTILAAAPALLMAPVALLAAVPGALAALLVRLRPAVARRPVLAALGAIGLVAVGIHHASWREQSALKGELTRALEARDRGELDNAARLLQAVNRERSRSHAAWSLLGQIRYRQGRLDAATEAFEAALAIKPDVAMAHRHLAVIALRRGDREGAATRARAGLVLQPDDLQLRYLLARAQGGPPAALRDELVEAGPDVASAMAALAFEVGDTATATALLDAALERWPGRDSLRQRRALLSQAVGLVMAVAGREADGGAR